VTLRGTQVLLARLEDRDAQINELSKLVAQRNTRIQELEARKRERRWQVHVAAFMYTDLTRGEAEAKLAWFATQGLGFWVKIVEDP
jgi:hypothetical protein